MTELKPKKAPLDIKFIGGVSFVFSLCLSLLGFMLISGIAKVSSTEDPRRVFMGIFLIESEFSHGLHELSYGLLGIIAALGLIWLKNWAWYMTLGLFVICFIDYLFVFSRSSVTTNIVYFIIDLSFIVWLFYRKPLFGSRK